MTWNQTGQGTVGDVGKSGVNRSSGAVNTNQNRSTGSSVVGCGASSVNPSTVKAKKAIFKGLKDI